MFIGSTSRARRWIWKKKKKELLEIMENSPDELEGAVCFTTN